MRWWYRSFSSDHHNGLFSIEHFHSAEVWGQLLWRQRLQVVGLLPVNYFTQTLGEQRTVSQGLGDAVLLANYRLWEWSWGERLSCRQQMWLGGGVKLPTGRFDRSLIDRGVHPNLQPGTGAPDGLLSAMYNIRHERWGFAADVLFRLTQENRVGYRFGHRLNSSGRFFYQTATQSVRWLPTAGVAYEWAAEDQDQGARVHDTGGWSLWGHLGLDIFRNRWAVGVAWQPPIWQHLGNGFLRAKARAYLSASVFF